MHVSHAVQQQQFNPGHCAVCQSDYDVNQLTIHYATGVLGAEQLSSLMLSRMLV